MIAKAEEPSGSAHGQSGSAKDRKKPLRNPLRSPRSTAVRADGPCSTTFTKNGATGTAAQMQAARPSAIVLPDGYQPSENEAVHERAAPAVFPQQARGLEGRDHPPEPRDAAGACTRTPPSMPTSPIAPPRRPIARSNSRARDRQRKLIAKIDAALARIEDGTLRLLRGDGRADRAEAPRCASHSHPIAGSAGAARAPREGLPGKI